MKKNDFWQVFGQPAVPVPNKKRETSDKKVDAFGRGKQNEAEQRQKESGVELLLNETESSPEKGGEEKNRREKESGLYFPLGEREEKSGIRSITIIGQIEGHFLLPDTQKTTKYEHILPALVAVEEDERAEGLLVVLNTVGGDVEAGLAIAEMIASMKKPTVSLVLGGGHSIGVPLAVSARRSFIVPSATMTVHPVRISGTVIGAPQTYFYLERVQERIVRFVAEHSAISAERLTELMMVPDQIATDIGSIIDGRQAVEEGIIDEVGGLSQAIAALKEMVRKEKEERGSL